MSDLSRAASILRSENLTPRPSSLAPALPPRPCRHVRITHARPSVVLPLPPPPFRLRPHNASLRFAFAHPLHAPHSNRPAQPTQFPLPPRLLSRPLELLQRRWTKPRHSPSHPIRIGLDPLHQLIHPRMTHSQKPRHPQLRPRFTRRSFCAGGPARRSFCAGGPARRSFCAGGPARRSLCAGGPARRSFCAGGPARRSFCVGGPARRIFCAGGPARRIAGAFIRRSFREGIAGTANPGLPHRHGAAAASPARAPPSDKPRESRRILTPSLIPRPAPLTPRRHPPLPNKLLDHPRLHPAPPTQRLPLPRRPRLRHIDQPRLPRSLRFVPRSRPAHSRSQRNYLTP